MEWGKKIWVPISTASSIKAETDHYTKLTAVTEKPKADEPPR